MLICAGPTRSTHRGPMMRPASRHARRGGRGFSPRLSRRFWGGSRLLPPRAGMTAKIMFEPATLRYRRIPMRRRSNLLVSYAHVLLHLRPCLWHRHSKFRFRYHGRSPQRLSSQPLREVEHSDRLVHRAQPVVALARHPQRMQLLRLVEEPRGGIFPRGLDLIGVLQVLPPPLHPAARADHLEPRLVGGPEIHPQRALEGHAE